jgi:multicomponent K+:H+ antiporter subunit D
VFLGLAFAATSLVVAGLPPLSGFVGKLAMLSALLELGTDVAWLFFALLIVSGLCAAVALMRIGMRHFWTTQERSAPHFSTSEMLPIMALVMVTISLAVFADPVIVYAQSIADSLQMHDLYINAVMRIRPI